MVKKLILGIAAFAIICVAYAIYQWQDETPVGAVPDPVAQGLRPRRATRTVSTQPAGTAKSAEQALSLGIARIPPGESPFIRVYDRKGNAKIVFQATKWKPVSDTAFQMTAPTARLLLPGGQLAYVRADDGEVRVQRGEGNNFNPKSGWFRGHVSIFVDRTTPEWRKANPDLAEPEQRPGDVVKIWLDDVRFDLDLSRIESDGPITLQSIDARIEGRGLELVWNETDRRITMLRIAKGDRASIQGGNLANVGFPGMGSGEEKTDPDKKKVAAGSGSQNATKRKAKQKAGNQAVAGSTARTTTRPAATVKVPPARTSEESLAFLGPGDGSDKPKEDRIDVYHVVFRDNVVAEQKDSIKTAGRLKAGMLELMCELGARQRDAVQHSNTTDSQPAEEVEGTPAVESTPPADQVAAAGTPPQSAIELHWTGEVVVTPELVATRPAAEVAASGPRFHLIATGSPVEVQSRQQGDAICQRLEYHEETKQAWLSGSVDAPVMLRSGPHGQLFGEKIFYDSRAGIARVDSAGKMIDQRQVTEGPDADLTSLVSEGSGDTPVKVTKEMEISWQRDVQIEFGRTQPAEAAPQNGEAIAKSSEYLKHAVFRGNVSVKQPGQTIAADELIDVTFLPPNSPGEMSADRSVADRIVAQGNVHMTHGPDEVSCDRLEVEMTVDDTGRNIPKTGRAIGHAMARQKDGEIRAQDEMLIQLASVPRPVTDAERARFEAGARKQGYTPESAKWQEIEKKLRDRRESAITSLSAKGDVTVRDPKEKLDLAADTLDCSFGASRQITHALLVGREEQPAHVENNDIYARGARINVDVTKESVEVPGAGILRFYTRQDLDGRTVDKPIPVAVAWKERMTFRGQENTGTFKGKVRAVSENTLLDCQDLNIQFENVPKPTSGPAESQPADDFWIFGSVADALRKGGRPTRRANPMTRSIQKRPIYMNAMGDAVILSTTFEKAPPSGGPVARMLTQLLPGALQAPSTKPAAAEQAVPLASRVRVAGPQMAIDLTNQHFVVEGAGNLLIEDYRLPAARKAADAPAATTLLGKSGASFGNSGPSQTLFTWQNSMSFLNNRNVAVFDRKVEMVHRAGSEMVLSGELAAARNLDTKTLARLKGRRSELTCDNLLAEFERDSKRTKAEPSPLSGATTLKSLRASGAVRLEDGDRSAQGTLLKYDSEPGIVQVTGSPDYPPQIGERDERTGRVRLWRGESVVWNQKTGTIEARQSRVLVTGK